MDEGEELQAEREKAYRERIAELKGEPKPEAKPKKEALTWTTPPSKR